MADLVGRHAEACGRFTDVARSVRPDQWNLPTPCDAWDARALVEHVIGFHEFLVLRPLGVRAARPREGAADRWIATQDAIFVALRAPHALDEEVDYFDGATRRPGDLLGALTTDVLIHTWDLARAVDGRDELDRELCKIAYDEAIAAGSHRAGSAMFAPARAAPPGADVQARLLALFGRDPAWCAAGTAGADVRGRGHGR